MGKPHVTVYLVVAFLWVICCSGDGDAAGLKLPDISKERFRAYLLPPQPFLEKEPVETLTTLKTNPYPREAPFPEAVLNEWGLWEMNVPIERHEGEGVSMAFVLVPAGGFFMGSPDGRCEKIDHTGRILRDDRRFEKGRKADEGPVHEVVLRGFWIGRYEVTNEQYRLFQPKHRSGTFLGSTLDRRDQPVVKVSWNEACTYAAWLTQMDKRGLTFLLPTEAEWEYACRAGTQQARFWEEDAGTPCEYANIHDLTPGQDGRFPWPYQPCEDRHGVTSPVGSLTANGFGLHDLLGNVSEWCADWYDRTFYRTKAARGRNPLCTNSLSRCRVLRGGAWNLGPRLARSATRQGYGPRSSFNYVGFRLVMQPSEEEQHRERRFSHRSGSARGYDPTSHTDQASHKAYDFAIATPHKTTRQADTDISSGRHGRTKPSSLRENLWR